MKTTLLQTVLLLFVAALAVGCSTAAAQESAPALVATPVSSAEGKMITIERVDEVYGYQVALPPDWTWKELPTQGPGTPEDWPMIRIIHLYPQAWDAQINRGGPPDPTAKPVVAPVQIEVVVGPPEQFRRVYPEPTYSETIEREGLPVIVETDMFGERSLTRYVFTCPDAPELYVTLTDQLTGYPERVIGNEAIADLVPEIVQSFQFGSPAQ